MKICLHRVSTLKSSSPFLSRWVLRHRTWSAVSPIPLRFACTLSPQHSWPSLSLSLCSTQIFLGGQKAGKRGSEKGKAALGEPQEREGISPSPSFFPIGVVGCGLRFCKGSVETTEENLFKGRRTRGWRTLLRLLSLLPPLRYTYTLIDIDPHLRAVAIWGIV